MAIEDEILDALNRLSGYHPSKILREKREVQEEELRKTLAAQKEGAVSEAVEDVNVPKPSDREEGLIWEVEQFLFQASEAFNEIRQKYDLVVGIAKKSLDVKISDIERSPIDREFQAQLADYKESVISAKVDEKVLFDGTSKGKPITFTISDGKADTPFQIGFSSMLPEDLTLDKVRCHNIMEARRSEKFFEAAQETLKRVESQLKTKSDLLGLKKATLEERRARISSMEGPLGGGVQYAGQRFADALRKQQIKAATAKGRASALLLNIKV